MGFFLLSLRNRAWLIAISVLLVVGLIALITLGREVIADLEAQRAADSDSLQFTLTQVEVEYLVFKAELDMFQGEDSSVDELRRRFDIFYSRVFTLQRGSQFAQLRELPDWRDPLERISTWLNNSVMLIDGPKSQLSEQLAEVQSQAAALRPDVRNLSIVGLAHFARSADESRAKTARALTSLARLAVILFVVLVGGSVFLFIVNLRLLAREVTLAQTNQRMNKILSTALDGVIVADKSGVVTEFNPAAENIFGYSAGFAKGRNVGDLIVPKHLRLAHEKGMDRLKSGDPKHVIGHGRVKMEAKRASGQIFPVEIALQTAVDRGEEIVIGFIRDISLRVANEQELIKARDRALAGEQAKADFLTVMSHEIRTPLNGLLGNLSLLHDSGSKTEQDRLVRNMEISGQVLLSHVDSVLDIARLEAGKMELQSGAVDLSELVQGIVDGQSGNAAVRGNRISWQWVGQARPHVTSDEQRLRQVLLNLVGNAIKFTDGGSILVEAEVSEVLNGSDRAMFEFRVIDDGIGIAEDDQARIFQDFETVDPSIERATEGTGLGLAISHRLVKLLGGEIGVESIPNEGSVFWVRLPMELRNAFLLPAKRKEKPRVAKPLDILVVEDNQINLELVQTMLERDSHRVTLATNGSVGVQRAAETRFDVILMDISMPVMDGLSAARHIRNGFGACRETPIVALSANVLPDAVSRIRAAGMNAFLGKPISVESLRETLMSAHARQWREESGAVGKSTLREAHEELGDDSFGRLLAAFCKEMDAALAKVKELQWHEGDQVNAFREECHRLSGSAAVFGLMDLHAALQSLEQTEQGASEIGHQRMFHFQKVWEHEKAAIDAELQTLGPV